MTDLFIWDTHAGFEPSFEGLGELEAWVSAGVNHVSVNVGYDVMPWADTVRALASYRSYLERADDRFLLVRDIGDVDRARETGRVSVSFDLEGLVALADDIRMIEVYHTLGVRQMGFAYNLHNAFAGGCHDRHDELTGLGREAVAEMNRLGVIVDCSHVGRRSSLQIMEVSQAPVVFSHSNCAAIQEHGRNITDEQIRECAATGGVVGINGLNLFLGPGDPIETLVRHILHVAELVGPSHVGLGLDTVISTDVLDEALDLHRDFWPPSEGYGGPVTFVRPDRVHDIAARLKARGVDDDDRSAIMGGNFRRIARHVWR